MNYLKAWALANLVAGLLVSPLVIHHHVNGGNTPLEEPTSVNYEQDYKESKFY